MKNTQTRSLLCLLFFVFGLSLGERSESLGQEESNAKETARKTLTPTYANVNYHYGHQKNRLDLWIAESEEPTPLAIYIHGGGYQGGSKKLPPETVQKFLAAGISVAAIEYRFVQHAKLPAAHHDCRRALQFLRSKALEWNVDPTRIGAWGGSAGAQLCMYLAFHDDMADPTSTDPIARESTRLRCVATNGGQATMDLDIFKKWIPGYDQPHRGIVEYFGQLSPQEHKEMMSDLCGIDLLSEGDPPIYMSYGMHPEDPVPNGSKARGWKIHHVVFGIKLKEKMDSLGMESHLVYPRNKSDRFGGFEEFLIAKLKE